MREKYPYLPVVASGDDLPPSPPITPKPEGRYPCPCCGCITMPVSPKDATAYVCPVCFWENDVFLTSDTEPSDENHGMTLSEARENYIKIGACCEAMLVHARLPREQELPPRK